MHVSFRSGDLELEGDLVVPPACCRGAVICHPHPQYGGDMDNPVVVAVAAALEGEGYATLRFNFRGVGDSDGAYGGGAGEQDDARAAVAFLIERTAVPAVTLAGYSFGAMIALRVGPALPAVDRLIAVAPPLTFFDLSSVATCTKEKLFLVGDRDAYCPRAQIEGALSHVAEPKILRVISGADHFFAGFTGQLSDAVRSCGSRPA